MGNVFNRYGAGGGKSEGLYIWKKYSPEYTDVRENIKATKVIMENVTENVPIYSAYECTFDTKTGRFTLVNPTLAYTLDTSKTFDGFSATRDGDGANKYYMVNGYIGNEVYIPQSYNYPFGINYWDNDKTVKGELQINTSYFIRRYADPILTFLDYVISDKETDYPDKEVKDGYYYERAYGLVDSMGFSKYEEGSFTLGSVVAYNKVTHNLGVMPRVGVLWTNATTNYAKRIVMLIKGDSSSSGDAYISEFYSGGSASGGSGYTGQSTNTNFTFRCASTSGYYRLGAGILYNYILLA